MDYYCSSDPLSSLTTSTAASSSCALLSYSSIILPPSASTTQKSSSSSKKYKGVVPQPNGRWGAQLYNGRKRVWIGTFDSREHAAHAYDIAILRFRGPHNFTNFPIRHYGGPHTEFLASLSESRVIDMLRNHTYQDELARFKRARIHPNPDSSSAGRELLFKKVMTPSDVGRLHRLVIPKHHAESYFPKIDKNHHNNNNKNNDDQHMSSISSCSSVGKMLSFEDGKRDKMWKFKYCYWKSSQNYVLTKGWGDFVRDKGLKPGDTVYFCSNNTTSSITCDNKRQFYIDTSSSTLPDHDHDHDNDNDNDNNNDNDNTNTNDEVATFSRFKALRLFGVDIRY